MPTVYVKTLAGQMIPIEVSPMDNGIVIRQTIAKTFGGEPTRMSLLCRGQRDMRGLEEGDEIDLFIQDEMAETCEEVVHNYHGERTKHPTFHVYYKNGRDPWGTKIIVETKMDNRARVWSYQQPRKWHRSLEELFVDYRSHLNQWGDKITDSQVSNMIHLLWLQQ